jgi:hypothetical protein
VDEVAGTDRLAHPQVDFGDRVPIGSGGMKTERQNPAENQEVPNGARAG